MPNSAHAFATVCKRYRSPNACLLLSAAMTTYDPLLADSLSCRACTH